MLNQEQFEEKLVTILDTVKQLMIEKKASEKKLLALQVIEKTDQLVDNYERIIKENEQLKKELEEAKQQLHEYTA